MATELTASQRAQLFAMSTRQNMHMLARETANTVPATVQFRLPKSRLLSALKVKVKMIASLKGVDQTFDVPKCALARIVRRVALDLNNGFSPFVVSGEELHYYNLASVHGNVHDEQMELKSTVAGTQNHLEFNFTLENTLNGRDPVGLILLQNDQTNVNLSLDFGNAGDLLEYDGLTITMSDIKVDVATVTYSIPANANAYPDLSVLKLVNGRSDSMPTTGQQIIKLATGTIYRKILFGLFDEDGAPMEPEDINGNFELVFNQADVNYSISAEFLRDMNTELLGYELPKGVYLFDFSNAGSFTGLGGTRDYIDTANLSEFWLRFNSGKRGKVDIVTECLSRLTKTA